MIRRPLLAITLPALLLAGCAISPAVRPNTAPAAEKPIKLHEAGLDRVIGKPMQDLVALFGPADLDTREGQARRLQFVGPVCVLDAYLYPDKPGGQPVATYVDARLPTGTDMDRASCVAALSRRAAAP